VPQAKHSAAAAESQSPAIDIAETKRDAAFADRLGLACDQRNWNSVDNPPLAALESKEMGRGVA
jgi:hypothetical protein